MKFCEFCDQSDIEDNLFYIEMSTLSSSKNKISYFYYMKVVKLIKLCVDNTKELNNLGNILVKAEKLKSLEPIHRRIHGQDENNRIN